MLQKMRRQDTDLSPVPYIFARLFLTFHQMNVDLLS